MKGFDVATDTTGRAHDIQAGGYGAVGLYLRFDRTSVAMVEGLHSVGIKVFSIYELGFPTSAKYFSAAQGEHDAITAVSAAKTLGQPNKTPIFMAFDYDASPFDIKGACRDYMIATRKVILASNYYAGAYGSGSLLKAFLDEGIVHNTFLAQSTGWAGYSAFKNSASIVQGPVSSVLGLDVDLVEVKDLSVLW